jgi:hypothetical protein
MQCFEETGSTSKNERQAIESLKRFKIRLAQTSAQTFSWPFCASTNLARALWSRSRFAYAVQYAFSAVTQHLS